MKNVFLIPAILLLAVTFICAGCIQKDTAPDLPLTDLLNSTLDKLSLSLDAKMNESDARLTVFADSLSGASSLSEEEINRLVREYYIDNIKLSAAAFYDARHNVSYITPFASSGTINLKEVYDNVSFRDNATILYGPIVTKYHGTVAALVRPVYQNGEYTGIAIAYFDPVSLVTNAALEIDGLNGLGSFIIRTDGIIFYSTYENNIGTNIHEFPETWGNHAVYASILDNESGLSPVFSSRTPSRYDAVSKQAAWKTISMCGMEFRLAVVSCEKFPELPADYTPDYSALKKAVHSVYLYAYEHGKEQTLAELNNPKGRFAYDDFDILALDLDGNLLASQHRPYQVNSSLVNVRSAYGMRSVETWADIAATSAGGWYYSTSAVSEDPVESVGQLSAVYLMLVETDWFICAQIPAQAERIPVNVDAKNTLLKTMQTALQMYVDDGEAALQEYMYRNGTALEGDTHNIVVLDNNGTILSSSAHPRNVGTDALYMTLPSTGVSITRLLILKAENGGGFVTADFHDSKADTDYVAVLYIEPLNDHSFIVVSQRTESYAAPLGSV